MRRRSKHRNWTKILSLVLVCCMATAVYAWADEEEKPTADVSISLMSQYIWRGQELSRDSLIIQPSLTIGYKGFAANIWQNIDTDYWDTTDDVDSLNETDITLSYGHDFGSFGLEAGYIWYSLDVADDSHEVYASATLNTLLSPTLTVYREFAHYPGSALLRIPTDVCHLDSGLDNRRLCRENEILCLFDIHRAVEFPDLHADLSLGLGRRMAWKHGGPGFCRGDSNPYQLRLCSLGGSHDNRQEKRMGARVISSPQPADDRSGGRHIVVWLVWV